MSAEATVSTRLRGGAQGVLGFVVVTALTFLGLLAITFFIGRVVPIDPVLSVVGDRATQAQYEAAKVAMGLDRPLIVQFAANNAADFACAAELVAK